MAANDEEDSIVAQGKIDTFDAERLLQRLE